MLRAHRVSATLLFAFASLGGASSCLYDANDRCDPGQTYDATADLCTCPDSSNSIAGDHGCVPCGDNQVAMDGACVCIVGYTMSGGACSAIPTGLGADCKADSDCHNDMFSVCQTVSPSDGYCTSTGCTSTTDCTGGYACATDATPTFCERPPVGDGMACKTSADCAGTEATYCENNKTDVCYVEGCSLTKNDCFPGKECCDLTKPSFGLIKKQICVVSGSCAQ